ncbi:hypothetical protein [Sediminimonas qiaohouensis]|uniref:hypothetical protein n=1 Tax=Sediminimonas qiaohouensis TaxID=552061 RepID=UPI001B7FC3C2|nr:hypothetical protein [Sediminimonas qiaohouensis]
MRHDIPDAGTAPRAPKQQSHHATAPDWPNTQKTLRQFAHLIKVIVRNAAAGLAPATLVYSLMTQEEE